VQGINVIVTELFQRPAGGDRFHSGYWVPGAHEKDLQTQAFSEAAEGIRTLDLLHGKQ
jgi:hypothetical protein